MPRSSLLVATAATTGCLALLLSYPGGIQKAEGCSGSSPSTYTAAGWSSASWAVDPTGVPIDGAVRLIMTGDYQNTGYGSGDASGAGATITVIGPGNSPVPGAPDTVPAPEMKSVPSGFPLEPNAIVTWRPSAPFQPSTSYTLRIEGLLSGAVDLSFTTGSQPFQPPKPILANPSLSVSKSHFSGPTICCQGTTNTSCGFYRCAEQMIQPAPSVSATIDVDEPNAAAKIFIIPELQVSVNDGPFESTSAIPADFEGVAGKLCARVQATNTLTQASSATTEWCATTDALDLSPIPNCNAMAVILGHCGAPGGIGGSPGDHLYNAELSGNALNVFQAVCGSVGSPDSGAQQEAGPGAQQEAGPQSEASAEADDPSDGCSAGRARASGGTGLVAMAIALLAAALRSRIPRRPYARRENP